MTDDRGLPLATVLIVDDRQENLLAFEVALRQVKCQTVRCASGKEALQFLEQNSVAAILLDVQMPQMNGLEVAARIRKLKKGSRTPILFITANDPADLAREAYSLGAVDFILKPVDPDVLRAKVRVFVDLFETTRELERKTALLEADAESEKTFILEHALDGVVATDEHNKVTFWNEHAEKLFGWSKAEMVGRDITELIIPHRYRDLHRNGVRRFVTTGIAKIQNKRIEIPGLRRNGEEFPMELTVSSVKTQAGHRFYSFMRELTELRETERKLRSSEAEFRTLVNSIPQLAWMAKADGNIFWYNKRWYEYTGKTAQEMEGWGWQSVHDPAVLPAVLDKWKHSIESGEPFEMTFPLRSFNGEFRQFLTRVTPLKDENSQILRWIGTNTDVQETTRALKEAEVSAQNLTSFFMQAPLPMVILEGPEHRFSVANPPYEQFVGRKVQGKTVLEAFTKEEVGEFVKQLDSVYKTGVPYIGRELPLPLKNTDGSIQEVFVDVGYHAFRGSDGMIKGVLAIHKDVTDHVQTRIKVEAARAESEAARIEAVRANELKSAFLANMSHEIRTPLGAMIGFADLLRDHGLTRTEQTNYIDIMARNGEQLSVIINDILDLSKVEAGHLVLEFRETRPDEIGADVISLLRVKAKEKDLALEYAFDELTPQIVVSDPVRVRQVLLNLVANAIKFTKFGAVKVRSKSFVTSAGVRIVGFEIEDTGIGIPISQLENVFEMFVQADGSMTRRFGGTGLGLALSRRLARALGGDVQIVRSSDKGSLFSFTFEDQPHRLDGEATIAKTESKVSDEIKEDILAGARILVVDDAPDNQQLIWRYLTKYGAIVDSAENGFLGYRKALSGDFDLILMDIQMPEMDGYTATQKLRSAGYTKPIIALTAHAMSEVRRKCLNVGCTDHLSKPINPKELIRTIAKLTSRS